MTEPAQHETYVSRRKFIQSAAVALAPCLAARAALADGHGRVDPPTPAPDIALTLHDGRTLGLPVLLRQHASAVQVMFTSCSASCPILGAIFRRVQELLPERQPGSIQLVSLSVDPEHDTPAALKRWLQGHRARPGWVAAAPHKADAERLRSFVGAGKRAEDNHSTRVSITDRDARLVWRTSELPRAEDIARILAKL